MNAYLRLGVIEPGRPEIPRQIADLFERQGDEFAHLTTLRILPENRVPINVLDLLPVSISVSGRNHLSAHIS
jgi:hypothetical protein